MVRTLPKTSRSCHGRSCRPNSQPTFAYEFGSRPSRKYLLLRWSAVRQASSGVSDHYRTFLPQNMRIVLCM
jgi:hypothetical protein